MSVSTFATAEELRAIAIIALVEQPMLYEEHQGAEESRAVERLHPMLHIGKREGMVIRNDLAQHHEAYGGGAYARLL